jgi:hypothetical protein
MPIRQQAINQLHNAESQMERKMTLIRPARFSWVTELVLTSRRRGQLWLSAVNFSAIQSHRAFHIDLWLATGPSTGYCPICGLFGHVARIPLSVSDLAIWRSLIAVSHFDDHQSTAGCPLAPYP